MMQAPVSFHIQARDGRDQKLSEGGDYVVVRVIPGSTARAAGAKESEAIVKDNGDGSYTATYSVEARGDYQVGLSLPKLLFLVGDSILSASLIKPILNCGDKYC